MNDKLRNNETQQNSVSLSEKDIPIEWFVCPEEKTGL